MQSSKQIMDQVKREFCSSQCDRVSICGFVKWTARPGWAAVPREEIRLEYVLRPNIVLFLGTRESIITSRSRPFQGLDK